MKIDLHNHTPLCNHASGSMSEFVEIAINKGIDIYGFSCHAPMKFDEAYRMSLEQLDSYVSEFNDIKAKVGDKIELLLGLEVDFILNKEYLLESSVLNLDLDYLIGSVHFLDSWGFDNPAFLGEYAKRDMHSCWELYLDSMIALAQSGHFQIIGHFDLLKLFGHKFSQSNAKKLNDALDSIANNHLSLELNPAGWRKPIKEQYPSREILESAYKKGIEITFGSDAHEISHIGFKYDDLAALAKSVGYKKANFYRKKEKFSTAF